MTFITTPGAIPTTYAHEARPHVCGKCRNPFTIGNPACPNAPKADG